MTTKRDLSAQIDEFKEERDALQSELAGLTEKRRNPGSQRIQGANWDAYLGYLGIAKAEIGTVKIGTRPGKKASGSSGPRILLGYAHGTAGLE